MQSIIESAWEDRSLLEKSETQEAIREVINQLDTGKLRVASPIDGGWQVNEWVKKAVVLYFPIQKMETIEAGPMEFHDKIPLKKGIKRRASELFLMPFLDTGHIFPVVSFSCPVT